MIPSKLLEGLNAQLTELFSDNSHSGQQELRNAVNRILQSTFSRLELVTREEFDAQTEVLQRTRAMVEQLEQRLAELEQADND
jgi:BMFP domain-containing protein YqiC